MKWEQRWTEICWISSYLSPDLLLPYAVSGNTTHGFVLKRCSVAYNMSLSVFAGCLSTSSSWAAGQCCWSKPCSLVPSLSARCFCSSPSSTATKWSSAPSDKPSAVCSVDSGPHYSQKLSHDTTSGEVLVTYRTKDCWEILKDTKKLDFSELKTDMSHQLMHFQVFSFRPVMVNKHSVDQLKSRMKGDIRRLKLCWFHERVTFISEWPQWNQTLWTTFIFYVLSNEPVWILRLDSEIHWVDL